VVEEIKKSIIRYGFMLLVFSQMEIGTFFFGLLIFFLVDLLIHNLIKIRTEIVIFQTLFIQEEFNLMTLFIAYVR